MLRVCLQNSGFQTHRADSSTAEHLDGAAPEGRRFAIAYLRLIRWVVLVLCLISMGHLAQADPREILVEALTTNDVEAQALLIQKLAHSAEPIVSQTLSAWRQGGIYLFDAPNGAKIPFLLDSATDAGGKAKGLQISNGQPLKDQAGQPLLFASSDLTPVDTTSKLRKVIKITLDLQALSAPAPNVRRDVATKLAMQQNADYLPYFHESLEREKVASVRSALREAIAITELASDKADVQLRAVKQLDDLRSISALELISKLESNAKKESLTKNAKLLAALSSARNHIERPCQFRQLCWHLLSRA